MQQGCSVRTLPHAPTITLEMAAEPRVGPRLLLSIGSYAIASSGPAEFLCSSLFQAITDFVETCTRATIIEVGAGRAGCPDRSDEFVVDLDHQAAAEQKGIR